MNAVMEKTASRDYCHVPGDASIMMGAKLAALVCKHMRAVLRAHTRDSALKNNVEYCHGRDIRKRSQSTASDAVSAAQLVGNK
jgi:hypothetical protein